MKSFWVINRKYRTGDKFIPSALFLMALLFFIPFIFSACEEDDEGAKEPIDAGFGDQVGDFIAIVPENSS